VGVEAELNVCLFKMYTLSAKDPKISGLMLMMTDALKGKLSHNMLLAFE
jgi:hypothetical protein